MIDRRSVQLAAVNTHGVDAKLRNTQEELAELIAAISRYIRKRTDEHPVLQEMGDVWNMLEQLALIFGEDRVQAAVDASAAKLNQHLQEGTR